MEETFFNIYQKLTLRLWYSKFDQINSFPILLKPTMWKLKSNWKGNKKKKELNLTIQKIWNFYT